MGKRSTCQPQESALFVSSADDRCPTVGRRGAAHRTAPWWIGEGVRRSVAGAGLLFAIEVLSIPAAGKSEAGVIDPPMAALRDSASRAAADHKASAEARTYWNRVSEERARETARYISKKQLFKALMEEMEIPHSADPGTRVRFAYDWINTNIRNLTPRSDDASGSAAAREADVPMRGAEYVLEKREGSSADLVELFIGVARVLGVPAWPVLAVDRTEREYDPNELSTAQFTGILAGIHLPDEPGGVFTIVEPGLGLPYGQVGYWWAGGPGLMATAEGAKIVDIPAAFPEQNRTVTRVSITFDDDASSYHTVWARSSMGASSFGLRSDLSRMSTVDRQRSLEQMCGSSSSSDVSTADVEGLGAPTHPLELRCEGDTTQGAIFDDPATHGFGFYGPWIEAYPDFPQPTGTHPVTLGFPRLDETTIELDAPDGFRPGVPPPSARYEMPFARYELTTEPTETGFKIERRLTILRERILPFEYDALRSFFFSVRKTDRRQLQFVGIESPGR